MPDSQDTQIDQDFSLTLHGSIALIHPYTNEVREWIENHVTGEPQWYSGSLAVEPPYLSEIVNALMDEGFIFVEPTQN